MSMRSPAPSLGKVEFLVLLWTTFAAFAALYGPQPLLPVIQQHFGVDSQSASLLMTLAILPLGLARSAMAISSTCAVPAVFCS